jgi:multidrug efflux pump subunit AcrB
VSIEAKVYSALSSLVSIDQDGLKACYPDTLKQGVTAIAAFAAIAYQVISSVPGPVTQLGHVNNFRVQLTLAAESYAGLLTLRAAVLAALQAMPEFVTYDEISHAFEYEAKAYARIIDAHFRNAET